MQKRMFGDDSNGKIIENLLLEIIIVGLRTLASLDWLGLIPIQRSVKKQEEDPLCNVTYSVGFYYYLWKPYLLT